MQSRRNFLRVTGSALAASALAGSGVASAAEKPSMRWEPAHYSNYTNASRSNSDLRWIVVHTIEGDADAGISWFKTPRSDVSSHFVVSADGEITKMVNIEDVAWTNGNGPYNDTGINIEMAGHAGETDFSEAMYEAVGNLVAYLTEEYDVPRRHPTDDIAPCSAYDGRGGIVGHEQIPAPDDCSRVTGGKVDPGPTWNWDYFMGKVTGSDGGGGGGDGGAFEDGQRVKTTANLHVHTDPDLGSPDEWLAPEGSAGYVRAGPEYADGYTWWKVGFNAGHEGWAVQEYLTAAPIDDGGGGDDGGDGDDGDGGKSGDRTIEDEISSGGSKTYTHAPSSGVESVTLDLAGPSSGDLDLYATFDGRTPNTKDFDARSWSSNSDESIEVPGSRVEKAIGILVDSYRGGGEFTLTITETGGDGGEDGGDGEFDEDTRVETTTDLWIHDGVGLDSPNDWLAPEGSAGYVRDGPESADGYTWWEVEFNAGHRGWCVQEYLEVAPVDGGGDGRDDGATMVEGVPYFYQYSNDLNPTGSCQNTSLAMLLQFYGWSGDPDDVTREWPTSKAQTPGGGETVFDDVASDAGLGVEANGYRRKRVEDLERYLDEGKPVVVYGWLTPSGHVLPVVGYDEDDFYVNDPAGEWDERYKGDHSGRDGSYVAYDREAFVDAISPDGYVWMVVPE